MSTPVLVSTLSRANIVEFIRELTIQEIVPMIYRKELRKMAPARAANPPIEFFRKVSNEIVLLPYAYARAKKLGAWSDDPAHARWAAETRTPPRPLSEHAQFSAVLRPHQEPVMVTALDHLETFGSTTLGVYPGFGKTAGSAFLIIERKKRAVIVMNGESLITQWKATFDQFTTGLNVHIWDARTSKKPLPDNVDVVIAMNTQVARLPHPEQFGTLVLDEAHSLCTPSNVDLFFLFSNIENIILCSATLERKDGMHRLAQAAAGTHGIFLGNPVPFQLVRVQTGISPFDGNDGEEDNNETVDDSDAFLLKGDSKWQRMLFSLARNKERNALLVRLITQTLSDRKVVVVTFLTQHVELLAQALTEAGEPPAVLYKNQRSYKDARVLVGSSKKISVGFDPMGVCVGWDGRRFDALVLCTSIASIGLLIQTFGRAFRSENPMVYFINDDDTLIDKHWRVAAEYAKEAKGTIVAYKP